MKKAIAVLVLLSSLVSCKWSNEEDNKVKENDSAKDVVLGGDKDKNGCLASAGYTWSKLNKECVRVFSGIQLLPNDAANNADDETLCAYVLFDDSGDNAEVFLPNQDDSLILKRSAKGKPWTAQHWQLVPYKGYQLKKDNQIVYAGDGEIGNKVTGSDESEDTQSGK